MNNKLEKILSNTIANKRVLILGFGKEGRSTSRVLTGIGGYASIDVADENPAVSADIPPSANYIGGEYMDVLGNYDIIFKTPGIALQQSADNIGGRICSQMDTFLSAYSAQTIGITGTKGKSTVATLMHHVLETAGRETILAGNIGTPVFDIAEQMTTSAMAVVEMSCHQLEHCGHSPSYAVLLNIYEDHLDHYGTFERYANAKTNIYNHQSANDTLYARLGDLPIKVCAKSRIREVAVSDLPFSRFKDIGDVKLQGQHNLLNAAFVYDVCKDIGIGDEAFITALRTFAPLRHRLEYIGIKNGIDYYDDSISTTAESTICAVESVPNAKTLIIGGMDRGIDYEKLVDFLLGSDLSLIIGMYESGKRIRDIYNSRIDADGAAYADRRLADGGSVPDGEIAYSGSRAVRFVYADDLNKAADIAQKQTPQGTACILSPAAASYGNFTNFEQRGDAYRKLLFG